MKELSEQTYSTVTFALGTGMSSRDAAISLSRLGVGLPAQQNDNDEPDGSQGGIWAACGLRSDGMVELWLAHGAPGVDERNGLEQRLVAAGLPYVLVNEDE